VRGLTIAVLCALAVVGAGPHTAAAESVSGLAFAGPALAGETVVWGQEFPDGRAAVFSRAPGEPVRAVQRLGAVTGRGHRRDFGGIAGALSASPTRIAYALQDSVIRQDSSDSFSTEVSVEAQLSIGGAKFSNPLGCDGAYVSTAAEGDVVAVGVVSRDPCGGVWIAGSPARRISATPQIRQVRLAGPWVAWIEDVEGGGRRLMVADVATGATVATFDAPDPRSMLEGFDLDDRGTVVAASGETLIAFTVSDTRARVLVRHIWNTTPATANGRVAYISQRDGRPDRLLLAGLSGRVLRRLDRYGPARQPVGEIALTDGRAAWSVLRARGDLYGLRKPRGSVLTVRL
jgi:hypothetical protein